MGQKFHQNHSITHGFRDISTFVFCNFCEKFENSKWPPFLVRQIFFENWDGYSAKIPAGQRFCRNHSIAHGFRDKHFCVFFILKIHNE